MPVGEGGGNVDVGAGSVRVGDSAGGGAVPVMEGTSSGTDGPQAPDTIRIRIRMAALREFCMFALRLGAIDSRPGFDSLCAVISAVYNAEFRVLVPNSKIVWVDVLIPGQSPRYAHIDLSGIITFEFCQGFYLRTTCSKRAGSDTLVCSCEITS